MIKFEHLCDLSVDVGELVSMGPAPLGERRVVMIAGGTFEGPAMRGTVVGGADWQIARADGVLELDARYALRDDRGGIVQVISQGFRHAPPEVMARPRSRRRCRSKFLLFSLRDAVRDRRPAIWPGSTARSRWPPLSARRGRSICKPTACYERPGRLTCSRLSCHDNKIGSLAGLLAKAVIRNDQRRPARQ